MNQSIGIALFLASILFSISLPAQDNLSLKDYFTKYDIIDVESEKILQTIQSSDPESISIQIDRWKLSLHKSDIISEKYICTNEYQERFTSVEAGKIVPMNGYTAEGGRVSITVGIDFVQGFIKEGHQMYYIEPVRHFGHTANKERYVLYNVKDIIPGKEKSCGVNDNHIRTDSQREIHNRSVTQGSCVEVEYAIAADYQMFSHYGSVAAVEAQNIAVVNNMQTNYDDEFNDEIRFAIVEQYIVSTNGGDPWTSSTDANDLLNSFTSWAPNGFSSAHDLGTLWTYRDLNGSTVGLAWVGAVCSIYGYNILQDYTNNADYKRVLAAHEIGHNFNASHDSGSGYIMSPSVSSTTNWSTTSLNTINTYYTGISCLGACTPTNPEVNFVNSVFDVLEFSGVTGSNYCESQYKTISIPVKINRSTSGASTFSVSVASGGTVISGRDYTLITNTLTFPSGAVTTQYINVDIINDAVMEAAENFTLQLTWISGPAQVGSNNTCAVTINDGLDIVSDICCSPGGEVIYGNYNYYGSFIFLSAWDDARSRFLYLPGQLSTAGLVEGYFSGVSFYVEVKNSTQPYENFRIGIKNVSETTLNGTPWYETTEVYAGTVTTVQGIWNTITFDQPFYWDGTSSLYFEFCFDNSSNVNVNDKIRITNPVGGGTDQYVDALVDNGKAGCSLGAGSYTLIYGNNSLQPHLKFYQLKGVKVENTVNKSANTSIAVGETAHLYSADQKIIASVRNMGTTDIGCLEAVVSTVGTGKSALPFSSGKSYSNKTLQIAGDEDALYEVTLYYSSDQMTTWGADAARLNILKSNVPIASATLSNVEIVRPDTVFNSLGPDNAYVYKAIFSGFSWFALTNYNVFPDVSVTGSDMVFDQAGSGVILQNEESETYKIHVNNSGQLNATSISGSDYKTKATASAVQIKDASKGIVFKSPNNSNWKLTISNTGQLTVGSVSPPSVNVKQQNGNLSVAATGSSILLKSADGSCWRVYVNETGQLRTVKVICP